MSNEQLAIGKEELGIWDLVLEMRNNKSSKYKTENQPANL